MWWPLSITLVALLVSVLGVLLAWRGPRATQELVARIELLEIRAQQLGDLVTREQRRALAADARAAKLAKHADQEDLAAQARAVIETAAQQPTPPAPRTRDELKRELRRQLWR